MFRYQGMLIRIMRGGKRRERVVSTSMSSEHGCVYATTNPWIYLAAASRADFMQQ